MSFSVGTLDTYAVFLHEINEKPLMMAAGGGDTKKQNSI